MRDNAAAYATARKVIRQYELYHKGKKDKPEGLKAYVRVVSSCELVLICSHIVLTTYDMITGKEFKVFKGIPRWEVLCVDEGQRRMFFPAIALFP